MAAVEIGRDRDGNVITIAEQPNCFTVYRREPDNPNDMIGKHHCLAKLIAHVESLGIENAEQKIVEAF